MEYSGKKVIITGDSRGVGKMLTDYFLGKNATVIGISNKEMVSSNPEHLHYRCDLKNDEEIIDLFRKDISKKFGTIDILINNAAVLTSQYSLVMPVKNATDMMKVNLLAPFLISREAARLMKKNNWGRIINISSMAVELKPIGDSVYAATKAGMTTMTNIMAKEFARYNITCNTLGITAIETDMLAQLPRDKVDIIINNLPIPRFAKIEDITNIINFYCSPESDYVSGQTLYLGGIN